MANSLVLTIQTSPNIILVKDTKMDTITLDSVEYTMALQSINFTKKMYEPGVINANIQFKVSQGDWKTISKTNLDSTFKDKSVVPSQIIASWFLRFGRFHQVNVRF